MSSGFRPSCFSIACGVSGFGFQVTGFRLRVSGYGLRVTGQRVFLGSFDWVDVKGCDFFEIFIPSYKWHFWVYLKAACGLQCIGGAQSMIGTQISGCLDDASVQVHGNEARIIKEAVKPVEAILSALAQGMDAALKQTQCGDDQPRFWLVGDEAGKGLLYRLLNDLVSFDQVDDGAGIEENHAAQDQVPRSSASC